MEPKLIKLAFYCPAKNKTYLMLNDLEDLFTKTTKRCQEKWSKPVGIVAVFGSCDLIDSKLLSDWLIQYYESKHRYSTTDNLSHVHHKFLHKEEVLADGVYFWPKLFEIKNLSSGDTTFCLLLHIEGKNKIDYEFAASICSKAICISKHVEKKFNTLTRKGEWHNTEVTASKVSILIDEAFPNLKNKRTFNGIEIKKYFFDTIDKCILPTKQTSQKEPLKLNKLIPYFNTIRHILKDNSKQILSNDLPRAHTAALCESTHENVRHNTIPCPSVEPLHTRNSRKTIHELKEKSGDVSDPVTLHQSNHPERLSDNTGISCEDFNCTEFEKKITSSAGAWIEAQTIPWKGSELEKHLEHFKQYDKHNHFLELELAFVAIDAYFGDLRNIFDNHICFYGKENIDLLMKLSKKAFKHSQNVLKNSKLVHSDFVQGFYYKACQSLHDCFHEDNLSICNNEVELARSISTTLIEWYKIEMRKHFMNSQTQQTLAEVNNRVQRYILEVMSSCMDSGSRLNYVQTEVSKEMQDIMSQAFEQIETEIMSNFSSQGSSGPIIAAAKMYQKILKKIYEAPLNFSPEHIMTHHCNTIKRILSNVSSHDTEEIVNILNRNLSHIMSVRQELKCTKSSSLKDALCVRLTTDSVKIGKMTKFGDQTISYSHQTWSPAFLAASKKTGFVWGLDAIDLLDNSPNHITSCGYLEQFLSCSAKSTEHANNMLTKFFNAIKSDSEEVFEEKVLNLLILIPVWYTVEHRMRIYECAKSAGFLQTFVIFDSAAAAYEILFSNPKNLSSLVIPVTVSHQCIQIEIYKRSSKEKDTIQLVALTNLKREQESGAQALEIKTLEQCFEKALNQLPNEMQKMHKIFYKTVTSTEAYVLDEYIEQNPDSILEKDELKNIPSRGAVRLSKTLQSIRQQIIDYSTVSDVVLSESAKLSYANIVTKDKELNAKKPQLESLQHKLIKHCKSIRVQMQEGKVRVRGVLRKAANETLDRVESAAKVDLYTYEELLEFEKELMELVAEHEFGLE